MSRKAEDTAEEESAAVAAGGGNRRGSLSLAGLWWISDDYFQGSWDLTE